MLKRMQVTHADVQRAISRFKSDGGLIRRLPNAPDVRSARVNERNSSSRDLIERIRTLGYVACAE